MILFVKLKETYFFFFYESIFPVSVLDLLLYNIQTNYLFLSY